MVAHFMGTGGRGLVTPAKNPCYESSSNLEQNDVIALLPLFLVLNIFQCCSRASIATFEHVFNCWVWCFMFDILCLERISRRWTSRPLASSSKQGIFIINFNAN